jgi:hypothetical protein
LSADLGKTPNLINKNMKWVADQTAREISYGPWESKAHYRFKTNKFMVKVLKMEEEE